MDTTRVIGDTFQTDKYIAISANLHNVMLIDYFVEYASYIITIFARISMITDFQKKYISKCIMHNIAILMDYLGI